MSSTEDDESVAVTRSEEELHIDVRDTSPGTVGLRKRIEHEPVHERVDVAEEHAEIERLPPFPDDDGKVVTLDDGSISVPVFEEQLVVEKRRVLKERVVVRKSTTTAERSVEADLAREVVEVDADPEVADRVHLEGPEARGPEGR